MPEIIWPDAAGRISYPVPETSDQRDERHGVTIADPYRGLEDPGSAATAAWTAAQDQLTQQLLSGLPARPEIRAQLAEIWEQPSPGIPFERGGRWFQRRRPGGADQDVVYTGPAPDGCDRVLLDPAGLSADGSVLLGKLSVSPDGSALAYSVSESGSDWQTWHVRDVASAADRDDRVRWSKEQNAVWHPNGRGFFYLRLDEPPADREHTGADLGARVCFHLAGASQDGDADVFVPEDGSLWPEISLSSDSRYLIVSLSRGLGSGAEIQVLELDRPGSAFRVLLQQGPARRAVVAAHDEMFYVLTDEHADRGRIIAVPAAGAESGGGRVVVPECPDTLLEAHLFGGRLVCHYLHDACSVLRVFELDGSPAGQIAVPELCTLSGSQVRHERIEGTQTSDIVHFETESFAQSRTLWRHDLRSGETTRVRAPAIALPSAEYLTERVFVRSADGTAIPLFLTRRREVPRDGEARVLLYGYGGVGASFTPAFRPDWVTWIERGGVFALASLRGGGEYGSSWYRDGRLGRKQNVFDDFQACLRWLAASGWSRPDRIAISGGSNGGLLVGASLTQYPGLFGAAVAEAGVFDMLRYHLFTAGSSWKTEYGDPDNPAEFGWLAAYSPLHNTRPGAYPATLLTTGDHDDRVVPAHSLKFAAALQAAQAASPPVVVRVYPGSGHGSRSASAAVAAQADSLAFMEAALSASGSSQSASRVPEAAQ